LSDELTATEVARRVGVTPQTLRRWQRDGLIPAGNGRWTPEAAAQARLIARLRERGHSLEAIREATESGRLAFGYIEDLFPQPDDAITVARAARETGLEPALIERIFSTMGFPARSMQRLSQDDLQFLRYAGAVLAADFPLVAYLQLTRVYGQALAQISDAEVRLFHLYVHEPLMRDGVDGLEIAEEMEGLARELLPLASPIMDYVHQRYLAHFLEQDVIGHMEAEIGEGGQLGRLRVAIAFADLAGYTRLSPRSSTSSRRSRARCPRTRGSSRPSATRSWSSPATPRGWPTGPSGSRSSTPSARCRASASTPARRSTATATTTGARSTSPRAWSPAPRAGRCSSPAQWSRRRARTWSSISSARCG
jgi:DNA-binding transcriptional MerR regulator